MTLLLGCLALATLNSKAQDIIQPGLPWKDTEGQIIEAHGGGLLKVKNIYYWYGENKDARTYLQGTIHQPRVDVIGVSVYSSTDLHTWTYHGLALKGGSGDLSAGNVLERPKVLYNSATGKYLAAQQAMEELRTPEAAEFFSDAALDQSDNPAVLNRTFIALAANGDIDRAVIMARQLLQLDPNNDIARLVRTNAER